MPVVFSTTPIHHLFPIHHKPEIIDPADSSRIFRTRIFWYHHAPGTIFETYLFSFGFYKRFYILLFFSLLWSIGMVPLVVLHASSRYYATCLKNSTYTMYTTIVNHITPTMSEILRILLCNAPSGAFLFILFSLLCTSI